MTRDDTVELLRLRWSITGQRFNDATADAWAEMLDDVQLPYARTRLRDLVRAGATRVEVGQLCEGLTADGRNKYQPPPPEPCDTCDGTGLREADRHTAPWTYDGNPVTYGQVQPCWCHNGDRWPDRLAQMLRDNGVTR
jgi:hypothetical protein